MPRTPDFSTPMVSSMPRLCILGGGGHGEVAADIANLQGWGEIFFVDPKWPAALKNGEFDIVGDDDTLFDLKTSVDGFFVAIGDSIVREKKILWLRKNGFNVISLIHPSASISKSASIGLGTIVMAGVTINSSVKVKDGVIVNTNSSVDHGCYVEKFSHICPGVNIAGDVVIGQHTLLGIGACVVESVKIGEHVTVGAGSVVLSDIKSRSKVVGAPARMI